MKKIISLVIFISCMWSFSLLAQDVEDDNIDDLITPLEYKLYSAVLKLEESSFTEKELIVLREKTRLQRNESMVTMKTREIIKENLGEDITDDMLDAFASLNAKPADMENYFSSDLNVEFIKRVQEKKLFPLLGEGWKKFYKKYPDSKGIYSFSRASFNETKTKAFVYFEKTVDFGKRGSTISV